MEQWAEILSSIIGWIYFLAWSVSFWPQIFLNWKRKSVVGLNFDFVGLNVTGFIAYSIFNCILYWNAEAQREYLARHPNGTIPVESNDIGFALHAAFASSLTMVQTFIYEVSLNILSIVSRV